MRKVILQMNVTVDGFTAGPSDDLSWAVIDPQGWQDQFELYRTTADTVLLGRLNYEGFHAYWPAVANDPSASATDRAFSRWFDEAPKVVFSKTLKSAEWKNSRLAQADAATEIAQLKQQPGKNIVVMCSTRLAQSLMQQDLIDEFWLTVHPVAIGSGRRLFEESQAPLRLQLLDSRSYEMGPVFLHYARMQS